MAYSTLKAAIQAVIKQNGNNEITGPILQQALLSMINSLGDGYQFKGVATPATNPGTPDQNVFYIASEMGTYSNFGLSVGENEVAIFLWNGSWSKQSTGAASAEAVNQLGQEVNIISGEISTLSEFERVDIASCVRLGNAYLNASQKGIVSFVGAILYYYPVLKGKTYEVSSDLVWDIQYDSVGFTDTLPTIGGTYDISLINSASASEPIKFAPDVDGYILLTKRTVFSYVYEQKNVIGELTDQVDEVKKTASSLSSLISYVQLKQGALTKVGNAYLNNTNHKITAFANATLYYYPVKAGLKYHLKSELVWGDSYDAIGFSSNLPVIGNTYEQTLIVSDAAAEMDFTPTTDGYFLLTYRYNEQKVFVSIPAFRDLPLMGRNIAILGDSIMQYMGGEVPANTVTLKNYDDPTDTNVYQTSEATIVGGIIYLTSSLEDGNVTEDSIRLDVVNSAQEEIDSNGWDYIKSKLGAGNIINCGIGGATYREMGVVTAYPSVNNDALLGDTIRGFPNQVRMLKRLIAEGKYSVPDVIVIWMGINGTTSFMTDTLEEALSIPWETLSDDILGYSARRKFFGAIRFGIESLYREFPGALIVFFSPVMTNRGDLQIDSNSPAYRGYTQLQQVSAAVKTIAERYSCLFFDALTQIGVANFALHADTMSGTNEIATGTNLGNIVPTYIDQYGIHPNEAGKTLWGNYLCRILSSFYFDKLN